jgi:hypothetical protein
MIIRQFTGSLEIGTHHCDFPGIEVDSGYGRLVHVYVWAQMTDWVQNVTGFNGTGDDFGEHGLKDEVVFLVH